MNTSTAAVISPSTRPIARCIGCMIAQNTPKGMSAIPERLVSTTTENAPSWSVTMQPMTEAAMILSLPAAFSPLPENQLLCIIGL